MLLYIVAQANHVRQIVVGILCGNLIKGAVLVHLKEGVLNLVSQLFVKPMPYCSVERGSSSFRKVSPREAS